jgi:uncharacterized protein YprB with RNaseH-like and TPR domain
MLTNTFIHIQGIGLKTEADLWRAGIRSWDDLEGPLSQLFPPGRRQQMRDSIGEAKKHLVDRPAYFIDRLPTAQQWRLFPHFRAKTAFFDIETTGLSDTCQITTIALYDGQRIRYYVQGENLDDFPAEVLDYDVLVSYNGKSFDLPVINRYFGVELPQAHIDLRYILHNLGIKGGLKGCEKQLGLDRGDLEGTDGFMAVLLWEEYRPTGNQRALETLLAYNIMDTVNLELLMVEAYNRNLRLTPFYDDLALVRPPAPPAIPFAPDRRLLQTLQNGRTNSWPGSYSSW